MEKRQCPAALDYDDNDTKGCTGLKPGVTKLAIRLRDVI